VIDGHGIYRRGLRRLIETHFVQSRVMEAESLEAPVVAEASFDLMLIDAASLDHNSPGILQGVRAISPQTRFAVMSNSQARADVFKFLSEGFHGFLCKLQPDAELLIGLGDLLSGKIYVPRWLIDEAPFVQPKADTHSDLPKLTRRQREILPLLAAGMSTKEIAREMRIAPGTARIHTTAVLRILNARNRTEAAFLAAKLMRSI
jgi:DNA-binding NarL/FixJ family response regulator